jgi:peptidoglycan/xylan/chitin deacetylase (PgdA/CDA1 family)
MRLLRDYGVTATFTAAALALERAPGLAKEIIADGHEVCAHGHRWAHQHWMKEDMERDFIRKAADSIEKTCGIRPSGWLSRYVLTENTRRLLAEEGYTYHMDDYSDDVPFWDQSVSPPMLVLPYALDSNDMKMWTAPSMTPAAWLEYAMDTFEWLLKEGGEQPRMMSLGVHLRIIGRPGRIGYFERFLQHVRNRQHVWVATRLQIAQQFALTNPAPGVCP